MQKIKTNKYKYVFIFAVVFIVNYAFLNSAKAATFYFEQSPVSVSTGQVFTVQVYVDTQSESINLAEGTIHFPADSLSVISVDNSNSDFGLWPEDPAFSNTDGTITFSGGAVNPGYNGDSGKVFKFKAKAKKSGNTLMSFSDVSIRANDGLGTNVVDMSGGGGSGGAQSIASASVATTTSTLPNLENNVLPQTATTTNTNLFAGAINVSPFVKSINLNTSNKKSSTLSSKTGIDLDSPILVSDTQPDQGVWYRNNDVSISWVAQAGVLGIQGSLGAIPGDKPTGKSKKINGVKFSAVKNGVTYFNARYIYPSGWSPVSTYAIHIDNQEPESLTATKQDNNGNLKILLKASDSLSGVDHFSVSGLNDKSIDIPSINGMAEYFVPASPYLSEYNLDIGVTDRAGNSKYISFPLVIKTLSVPTFTDYSKETTVGDQISITGNSVYENRQVAVYFESPDKKVEEYRVDTDSEGNFELKTEPVRFVGDYKIWMQFVNERGEKSYESSHVSIVSHPKTSLLQKIIKYVNENMVTVAVAFAALVLGIASVFVIQRFAKRKRKK